MFKALGYHTFAKVVVVFAAYILHFCLGKVLSVDEYGVIGTVIAFCNFYYMFLTNGVRQGISKSLSVKEYDNTDVVKKGMMLQTIFSIALSVINFALAPMFAKAFGDPAFEKYIMLISMLIPLTAIYFAFTGGLNGTKLFLQEAIVIMIYPMLRLTSIPLALVFDSDKPTGIIFGFSLASLLAAILASAMLLQNKKFKQKRENAKKLTNKSMLKISFEFIIFFASITMILNMDTFFLQYVCKDTELTGYYTGVHTFSLVPYYLISAFYLVILPYVSENYVKGDMKKVKDVIAKNFNIITVFILPITALIATTGPELLSCFYSKEYYQAGNALSILCMGTFFLSSFAVLNVVLNGMNCKKLTKSLSVITVAIDVALLYFLIPIWGLEGAAIATTVSALFGCIVSLIYLIKKIGNPFDLTTMGKAVVLVMIFVIACRVVFNFIKVHNLIALIAIYAAFGLAYLLCVILFKIVDVKSLVEKKK
ncbi:MAG: oligosaccharide flippase family protein [Clostridiales bacterium]|nr:oligosaccharide flippase family protein [Clostridiales bacterium]